MKPSVCECEGVVSLGDAADASPLHSAMNLDRFERGPREILNPEIQKVSTSLPNQSVVEPERISSNTTFYIYIEQTLL